MGERRGTKALEFWCRRITEGYPDVNVQNMTTSWRDGLAFCAMIHHFRPDLIDFDSLDKNDIYGNNELAFRIAEQHLGIPALLDAEDMASCAVPDRLSILTYLSQFYQTFNGSSPARIPASRTTETVEERITQVSESPKEKEATCLGSMRKDVCVVCGFPIFLAEKLVLAHVAYHRTCFRCARCNNQLTIGNYYETEEGQYCCETCPDEDIPVQITQSYDYPTFSEIEKNNIDSSCQQFFSNNENINKKPFSRNSIERMDHESMDRVVIPDLIAQTSRLRLNFISNQLFPENDEQISLDNMHISENRSSIEGENTNLKTESRNLVYPFNTEFEKQSKLEEENKLNRVVTCLKLEPDNDGLLLNTNVDDYVHERLNIDKHEQDQTSVASLHNVIKETRASHSNDKELSDETSSESSYSIVEKRCRMFEKKKDDIERNKLKNHDSEVLKFKIQTKRHRTKSIGNSESPIINPDTTMQETGIGQDNARKYNAESFDKDSSTQIAPFELLSSRVSKVNKTLSIPLDTESIEHRTSTIANDINATNVICSNFSEDYPEDLNPFKSDEEQEEPEEPEETEETEEAEEMEEEKEKEEEEEEDEDEEGITDKSVTTMNSLVTTRDLTNPFENAEETEKKEVILPIPATRSNFKSGKANQHFVEGSTKRRLAAPQINLNPFWSDEEDHDSDLEFKERTSEIMPTPKPRTIKHNEQSPSKNGRKSSDTRDYLSISNNCLRSPESGIRTGGAYRKKKPAPLPPNKKECVSDQRTSSMSKLQCSSAEYRDSPSHKTLKTRKPRPAPPPPIPVSTGFQECPMNKSHDANVEYNIWEDEKTNKDETNRNRQSFPHITCEETFHCRSYLDKSMEGKWKRKKGPAPPCPIPHRRKIKVMSLKDVKLELDEIELQQQGLEKQGVRLEQLIRSKCESGSQISDISLGTDVEELVLELFTLVNEKNELFRRQAELMLLRRQQRLEEEHAEVEYQIRCLMAQNESTKTDFDKQREEALIQRLIEIVERRNEIVDCLEMDRRREIEEDRSIHRHMDLFAAKNKNDLSCNDMDTTEKKKRKQNKLKEKIKEKRLKRILKKDVDKDVDEMELTLKRHTKRKWF